MSIFYGKSNDGGDAREFEGFYVSPDGETWGNTPFTKEQRQHKKRISKEDRIHEAISNHINGKRSWSMEYDLVKRKESTLSSTCREYLISHFEK